MVGKYPMLYFSLVAFEVSHKNLFHAWMTCFSQLCLCRNILQTMSSCLTSSRPAD